MRTNAPDDHPFAKYVRILAKGKTGSRALSEDEAYKAFKMILENKVEDVQLGAFLMLLRVKEETASELAGFVQASRESMSLPIVIPSVTLDWSSYAGKKKHYPWYLLSALLLAQQGVRVFMHGAAGHTEGRIYSEVVLSALGITPARSWQDVEAQLDSIGFSFMPLSSFCPRLDQIIRLRPLMGVRSPVHTLSRLLNPTAAPFSLQSIFHPSYGDNHQLAAALLNQENAMVFKGEGGEVERRPEAEVKTKTLRNGMFSEQLWPKLLEGRQLGPKTISPEYISSVWRGQLQDTYAEAAVIGTTAFALFLLNETMGVEQSTEQARVYWMNRNTSAI